MPNGDCGDVIIDARIARNRDLLKERAEAQEEELEWLVEALPNSKKAEVRRVHLDASIADLRRRARFMDGRIRTSSLQDDPDSCTEGMSYDQWLQTDKCDA